MSLPFRVLHVGGRGDIASLSELHSMGNDLEITVCEADPTADRITPRHVSACISDHDGKATFHVTKNPQASSLFLMNPAVAEWTYNGRPWREEAELDHDVEVMTTTVDSLVACGRVEPPHFISLDAQGAEVAIFRGAVAALMSDVVGILAECEFYPIYLDQGLFYEQVEFLTLFGFTFQRFTNKQIWYPPHSSGHPMAMVAEALYIRDSRYFQARHNKSEVLHRLLRCVNAFELQALAERILATKGEEALNVLA